MSISLPPLQQSSISFPLKKMLQEPQFVNGAQTSFQAIQNQVEALMNHQGPSATLALLKTQMLCHRYQLHIEMLTRCADAAASTIKKLQGGS